MSKHKTKTILFCLRNWKLLEFFSWKHLFRSCIRKLSRLCLFIPRRRFSLNNFRRSITENHIWRVSMRRRRGQNRCKSPEGTGAFVALSIWSFEMIQSTSILSNLLLHPEQNQCFIPLAHIERASSIIFTARTIKKSSRQNCNKLKQLKLSPSALLIFYS